MSYNRHALIGNLELTYGKTIRSKEGNALLSSHPALQPHPALLPLSNISARLKKRLVDDADQPIKDPSLIGKLYGDMPKLEEIPPMKKEISDEELIKEQRARNNHPPKFDMEEKPVNINRQSASSNPYGHLVFTGNSYGPNKN